MESEKIKKKAIEIFKIGVEPVADVVSSMVFECIVGTVVPGITSAVLAYKQKRQEKMIIKFMEEVKKRLDELEEKIKKMPKEQAKEFTTNIFGIVTDFVLDEVQEEKIKYIVNGFINLASVDEISEDFVLNYYDTLNNLRMTDIRILKYYYNFSIIGKGEPIMSVFEELEIDFDQLHEIQNKMMRMGLLISQNEKYERSNLQYLKDKIDGNMRALYRAGSDWTDLNHSGIFELSKDGHQFMKFFIEKY